MPSDAPASRSPSAAQAEQSALLLENATGYAIFTMDTEARVVLWNTGAERILGWTEDEALGQHGAMIFTPEDRAAGAPEQELASARAEGRSADVRWHLRRDGSRFWANGTMIALYDALPDQGEPGPLRGYAKILRDETAQHEHQQALEARVAERTAQVRALAAAIGDAEADVRQRIATVLHDDLQQVLYGLHLGTSVLAADLAARPDLAAEAARAMQFHTWAGRALQITREVTLGLAVPADPDESLASALATLAAQTEAAYRIAVSVVVAPGVDLPDRVTRALVLQTVRELIFNAVKHAGVDCVQVEACPVDGGVETVVVDGGRGFDGAAAPGGLGLRRAWQRAEIAGGRLTVESAPGKGTRARLWVPSFDASPEIA